LPLADWLLDDADIDADGDEPGAKSEGRRAAIEALRSDTDELDENGEEDAAMLCVRSARFGGARGPPGTEGVLEMRTGRGFMLTGGLLVSRVPVVGGFSEKDIGLGRSRLLMLALRPSEEKKLLAAFDELGLVVPNIRREVEGRFMVLDRGERAG
jgi:hypothetical protein